MTEDAGRRIALLLEYDGAAYGGSQYQRNAPSIQGELEAALARLNGQPLRVALAGRTDAGVHATGQVAAFTTAARHSPATFVRALNALLPADIAVRAAAEVAENFDPRRHALRRCYRYCIVAASERRPLWRRTAWQVMAALDTAAMAQALAALPGEHDFAAFGGAPGPGRSTIRRMERAWLERRGAAGIAVWLEANAFLPHQVRRTVGALVEIGRGRLAPGVFAEWLARPRPGIAGPAAPPRGLTLVSVTYRDAPAGPAWWSHSEKVKQDEDI